MELPREGLATSVRAIVQNALDASRAGQKVELLLRRDEQRLEVCVVDRGEGMDPARLERALEPFFTTKDVGRGMGLGLYLASSFIEGIGGQLQIESSPGRGTRVCAVVPLARDGLGRWVPAHLVGAAPA